MNIARNPENIAEGLAVPECTLLFCVAGATDWQDALGVTDDTVTAMVLRGLVARDALGRLTPKEDGYVVLAALSKAD